VSESSVFTITVTYTDGTKDVFEYIPEADPTVRSSRTSQIMAGAALHLALEDGLISIPLTSIKCLEIFPALPYLPDSVVKNVRRVSSG